MRRDRHVTWKVCKKGHGRLADHNLSFGIFHGLHFARRFRQLRSYERVAAQIVGSANVHSELQVAGQ